MLKSSNFNSIINDVAAESSLVSQEQQQLQFQANFSPTTTPKATTPVLTPAATVSRASFTLNNDNNMLEHQAMSAAAAASPSIASQQLAAGTLQIFAPSMLKVRGQLKELIGKQNKIYIDLSAEKYKLDNAEMCKLQEMMNDAKIYREKLLKIKKQMQGIYQRTKVLKKRAANIQACKQKELQRKLQKQQLEESLIGK